MSAFEYDSQSGILDYKTILKGFFPDHFNLSHRKCFDSIIRGLFEQRSVNLDKLALSFPQSNIYASEQRIRRFLDLDFLDDDFIVPRLLKLSSETQTPGSKETVIVDRSQWKLGFPAQVDYNILQFSVLREGAAVPVMPRVLDNRGGLVSAGVLTECLDRLLKYLPQSKIRFLTADREFPYKEAVRLLVERRMPFVIRIKKSILFTTAAPRRMPPVERLVEDTEIGQTRIFKRVLMYGEIPVRLTVAKILNRKGQLELLALISSRVREDVLEEYRNRWWIEHSFRFFKSSGFNVDKTHIPRLSRIKTLWRLVMIAVMICWLKGSESNKTHPIKILAHGRRAVSIFRYGLLLTIMALRNIPRRIT